MNSEFERQDLLWQREIDGRIHVLVFGNKMEDTFYRSNYFTGSSVMRFWGPPRDTVPHYCTNSEDVSKVLEYFSARGWVIHVAGRKGDWMATVFQPVKKDGAVEMQKVVEGIAPCMERAVCCTVLKLYEVQGVAA